MNLRLTEKRMRGLTSVLGLGALALFMLGPIGCARVTTQAPAITASGTASAASLSATEQATRLSVAALAEREARDALMDKVCAMDSGRGGTLGELAVVDPAVKAVLMDTVREARISDKSTDAAGATTVTVEMILTPIQQLIARGPDHALK